MRLHFACADPAPTPQRMAIALRVLSEADLRRPFCRERSPGAGRFIEVVREEQDIGLDAPADGEPPPRAVQAEGAARHGAKHQSVCTIEARFLVAVRADTGLTVSPKVGAFGDCRLDGFGNDPRTVSPDGVAGLSGHLGNLEVAEEFGPHIAFPACTKRAKTRLEDQGGHFLCDATHTE